jgi:hypothetical protein
MQALCISTGEASMNGKKKRPSDRFKVKKPVKIQYASAKEVAVATEEILRQHSYAFEMLAKS